MTTPIDHNISEPVSIDPEWIKDARVAMDHLIGSHCDGDVKYAPEVAKLSYQWADAMQSERAKRQQPQPVQAEPEAVTVSTVHHATVDCAQAVQKGYAVDKDSPHYRIGELEQELKMLRDVLRKHHLPTYVNDLAYALDVRDGDLKAALFDRAKLLEQQNDVNCAQCGVPCCPICSFCEGCKRHICNVCDHDHHGKPDGTNHGGASVQNGAAR